MKLLEYPFYHLLLHELNPSLSMDEDNQIEFAHPFHMKYLNIVIISEAISQFKMFCESSADLMITLSKNPRR